MEGVLMLCLLLGLPNYSNAVLCEAMLKVQTVCGLNTGAVLNTLPQVRSRAECAVVCSQDNACRSSLFDSTGICQTYSEYKSIIPCVSEEFYIPVLESSCHVPPIVAGAIFSLCEQSIQCEVPGSECRGSKCQCLPGLSHDPVTNTCVADCINYSTTFQEDLDHLLVGFSDGSIAYTDLDSCKAACIAETAFVCRTIEIWKTGATCYLSKDTASTQPTAREPNIDYDLHQRDCAP